MPNLSAAVVAIGFFAIAAASGCGGSGGDDALKNASSACELSFQQASGQSDAAVNARRERAANIAAEAAAKDARWKDLARAVSDYAETSKDLAEATANFASLTDIQLQQMGSDLSSARRELSAACREVKAAGGHFSGQLP